MVSGITVAHASPSSSALESAEVLQGRLRVFAGLLGGLLAFMYVVGVVGLSALRPEDVVAIHLHPTKIAHAAAILGQGALFYALGRRSFGLRTLRAVDVAQCWAVIVPAVLTFAMIPVPYVGVLIALLIMLLTLGLRAALVPSPPARTVLIGVTCAVPLAIAGYLSALVQAEREPTVVTPLMILVGTMTWCGAIVAASTITSRVVYGLQREVQKATRLGQYTLADKLGEGGMGAVYLARHAMLRRPTAIKLLLPTRSGNASVTRFEREVQLTSMLTHPNTIAIYDYGRTTDGIFYYAMEYVDGLTLEDLVRDEGPLPAGRVIHVMRQVVGALAEAHRVGLIHRDVKPANILLCDRGGVPDSVKVVDFGLVKQLEAPQDATVTQVDTITGTPAYIAPEMIVSPDSVDGRADLYGLGGVAYFMATGGPVFEGDSVFEVCGHHLHSIPPPPSSRSAKPVPAALEELVLRCLAKKPEDRPGSAQVLEVELEELAQKYPWTAQDARAWWGRWRERNPSTVESLRPAAG